MNISASIDTKINYVSGYARLLHDLLNIDNRDFSILSSNCIGGMVYRLSGRKYLTPTVNLNFTTSDFLKFASDPKHYCKQKLEFINSSLEIVYPIARLGDLQINFMHYKDNNQAEEYWIRRSKRINYSNIYLMMTDRDGFNPKDLATFDSIECVDKVCFTAKRYEQSFVQQIPEYSHQDYVGDLYTNRHLFAGNFSFSKWLSKNQ
jgi:uncharacterized protein (DUF1919 family)